ncbi:Uncharacterised protein [Escherichia coli]|uniref:Uncharacterized protein n=1 Tax=Escherichia coli TaxID=562 RepID=A0A377DLR4_ECOLX|nr:Uncharacterised protein [Escherichia coli]
MKPQYQTRYESLHESYQEMADRLHPTRRILGDVPSEHLLLP